MKNRAEWSTEELVHHILSNEHDEEAFRVLYNRYELSLFKFVASKIDNRSDAEEIVQDTLFQAYKYLETLRDAEKLLNWLFSIADQRIIIHQKNQERIESVPISSVPKQTLADRAVAEDRLDQQRAIDDAQLKCTLDSVDTLPKRERDALRLQLEGLEYKQIADQLGVSVAVVRNLLYRARKNWRHKSPRL